MITRYAAITKKLEEIFGRALIGTQLNYPDTDISLNISTMVHDQLNSYMNGLPHNRPIFDYFSKQSYKYGIKLREEVCDFFERNKDLNMPAELLEIATSRYKKDCLTKSGGIIQSIDKCAIFEAENTINIIGFGVSSKEISHIENELINQRGNKKIILYKNLKQGSHTINGVKVYISQNKNIFVKANNTYYYDFHIIERKAQMIKNHIQKNRFIVDVASECIDALNVLKYTQAGLIPGIIEKRYSLINSLNSDELTEYLYAIFKYYINNLNVDELFLKDVEVKSMTPTAISILSNASEFGLKDSFSATLLNGNIDIASDKGYPNNRYAYQQDAVASTAINNNIYLNVVADGVGGSLDGQKASRQVVLELSDWFSKLPLDVFENVELLKTLIDKKMNELDQTFAKSNSQTTVVAAFTIGDITLIANIGDSTAYTYDYSNDKLIELTTSDSLAPHLSYEEFRRFPNNNIITKAIGVGNGVNTHFNIINNIGQKIILSSDGVTDLISERKFKNFFRNNATASYIVEKAINEPDIVGNKTQDNVSAIVVNLPDQKNIRRRGR